MPIKASVIQPTLSDLVKIDVEGAEFHVLRGANDSLKTGKIKRIMVELHDKDAKDDLYGILSRYGFKLKQLDPHPRIFGSLS